MEIESCCRSNGRRSCETYKGESWDEASTLSRLRSRDMETAWYIGGSLNTVDPLYGHAPSLSVPNK